MIEALKAFLKDKHHNYSLRELTIAICIVLMIACFLVQWIWNVSTPDYMFYALMSLISAACIGYSIERTPPNQQQY